jgi:hypothetical protein
MSASNPNTVTVVNQSGVTITSLALGHYAGISFVPPFGSDPILSVGNFANGATSPSGTAFVADGLADYWIMGVIMPDAGEPFVLVAFVPPVPYKKCDTPDNGSTQFIIGTESNGSISVTINTFNQNGTSDGSCAAVMLDASTLSDAWEKIVELIIEWLGDAAAPAALSRRAKSSPAKEVHNG